MIQDVIGLFQYLGFTPDKITPLLLLAWLASIYIDRKFKPIKTAIESLNHCVLEMQTLLRRNKKFDFKQSISSFGQSLSPMVLKKELKPLIQKSGLAKQVNSKLSQLVKLLKNKKPKNGIDAQDKIDELVLSGEIKKYLDLNKYEEYLYQKGKTSVDAAGILTVYLYEVLIPEVLK